MSSTNVFINKSTSTYPVKNSTNGASLGTILLNEIYGAADPHMFDHVGSTGCVFRSSSGRLKGGGGVWPSLVWATAPPFTLPTGLFSYVSDFPFSTVIIKPADCYNPGGGQAYYPPGMPSGGWQYRTLKARRMTPIYSSDADRRKIGDVAQDQLVALSYRGTTDPSLTFSDDDGGNFDWYAITFAKRSSDGKWQFLKGATHNYSFTPIGLENGSGISTINYIGTL